MSETDADLAARYRNAVKKFNTEITWKRKLPRVNGVTAGRLDGFVDALRILTSDEEAS